jgi:hypothetical protein
VLVLVLAAVSLAGAPVSAGAVQNVVVSPVALTNTPRIIDGRVYAIAETGGRVFVGGTFTTARNTDHPNVTRNRILSYTKATGVIDSFWAPSFDGDVNAISVSTDGNWLYVGGAFTTVNGTPLAHLVKISTSDPNLVDATFSIRPDHPVQDMELSARGLVIGGNFETIGNTSRARLAAVDPTTGAALAWFNVPVTDPKLYDPYVLELDVSADAHWLVIGGNFKTVGGASRNQLAVIDLSTPQATVADWSTERFVPNCAAVYNETYFRGVSISPDSSYFVVNTTGAWGGNTSMCDTATRWELPPTSRGTDLQPTWTTYTGGDTHWAVEVTESAVYVGGHQRWENNANPTPGGDNDGPGAVARSGIAALDPTTGVPLSWNPGRDRGRGVEAFLATDDHLYIGSDTTFFGGLLRQRLAVLPVAGGTPNPPPQPVPLPVVIHQARNDGTMVAIPFDGQSFGTATPISGPGIDGENWSTQRGAFEQWGKLTYYGAANAYYGRTFNGATLGPATNLSQTVGYVDQNANSTPYDQPFDVDTTRAAAYVGGRILYTRSNDSRLWWRWYSTQSGIIGGQQFVASDASFSNATGLEVAGSWLYVSYSDNTLWRMPIDSTGHADYLHRVLVDDGNVSGLAWSQRDFSFAPATGVGYEPTPGPGLTCPPETPIVARYFANATTTGFPLLERCENSGTHNFGTGSPGPGIPVDRFSARWTVPLVLDETRDVRFTFDSDDGSRVYLDGRKILDAWVDQLLTHREVTLPVDAGPHTVEYTYYDNTGQATANFGYEVLDPVITPPSAALVAGNAFAPSTGDVVLRDRLVAAGYVVTYVDDEIVDAAQAETYDVVWVAGSVSANALGARLKDASVPIVMQKERLLSGMLMATGTNTANATTMSIVNAAHPLAAGRSGTISVLTSASAMTTARTVAAGGVSVADPASAAYFAVPSGATRTDGTQAPNCRVSFPVESNGASKLTADGRALVDATIAYLAGSECAPTVPVIPPAAAVVTTNPAAPASGDVQLRDRFVAAGYVVTYVDDDTFDAAQAANFDVVWVAGNANATALGSRLVDLTAPVVLQKERSLAGMLMATRTNTASATVMTIVNEFHPLAAGHSNGPVTVLNAASALVSARTLAPGAVTIADATTAAYFAVPVGATRTDATPAPGCRVSFPVEFNGIAKLTADGRALLDAAIAYLGGTDC